ncbi:hypothetical protein EJB05_08665, partial [Eragrostis curvula]
MTLPLVHLPLIVLALLAVAGSGCIGVNAVDRIYKPDLTLCSGSKFIDFTMYQANRDRLAHSLCAEAAINGGFFNSSFGVGTDEVFGVVMCYIPSTWEECKKCLEIAPSFVSPACPNGLTGGLMYDRCILRYSDQSFASTTIDQGRRLEQVRIAYVEDMVTMNNSRWRMMNRLIPEAAVAPLRYANGSELYKDSILTYGLVQCRIDLTQEECTKCLTSLVKYFLDTNPNTTAGSVREFSCYVQYHEEPIIILMNPPGAPTPPAGSKKDGKLHLITGFAAASSISLFFALSVLLWIFIQWCLKRIARDEMEVEFSNGAGPKRFDYNVLAVATCHFSDDQKLGEGGFGSVYRGFLAELSLDVAIKRVSRTSKQGRKEYASEVKIISRLRHRNLVQLIGWCHSRKELLLVYQLMPNGSLDAHLYNDEKMLPWSFRYDIVLGIGSALLYLHQDCEQGVLHRDIKPSNVMLDESFCTKLGDFGLARLVDHGLGAHTTELAGTMGYMDPECMTTGRFSTESDMYSFGVVLLEIACGRRPVAIVQDNTVIHLAQRVLELHGNVMILDAADPQLNGDFDAQQMERVLVVGLWCTQLDRSRRPSIRQAVSALLFEMSLPTVTYTPPVRRLSSIPSFILEDSDATSGSKHLLRSSSC